MYRKRISINWYDFAVLGIIAILATVSTGCATSSIKPRSMAAVSSYFDKDKELVWEAVLQAVEGMPVEVKDKEKGKLITRWVSGWSQARTTGLILEGHWHERHRLLIKVMDEQNKTYVSISAQVEEKSPGGSQAFRWNRVPSDGTIEQEFFDKLEKILSNM